jgi:hypothetical protein
MIQCGKGNAYAANFAINMAALDSARTKLAAAAAAYESSK